MLETPIKKQIIGNLFRYVGDPFYCDVKTPDEVRNVLAEVYEKRRIKSLRLRIWYGNVQTGRAWNDTFNVKGYIARTAARYPQPLLVQFKSSIEGEVLSTSKIVRIDIVESGETVYAHENFHIVAFSALANVKESDLGQKLLEVVRQGWFWLNARLAR